MPILPYRPPRLPPPRRRIPVFHAVPGRARSDGWTPLRQAEFIGLLAETRSVSKAAQTLGMRRETAYRLRQRPWAESFCAAWDAALGREGMEPFKGHIRPSRKVTLPELEWRVETGLWQVIIRAGRYRGVRQKAGNSALLALVRQSGVASLRGMNMRAGQDFQ